MATVPSLSQLNDMKDSLGVWVEIIGMLKECFSALSKNEVLKQALVQLATESKELDDAEQEGLNKMIEYCRQSSVAERKARTVVGTIYAIVKSTLKALQYRSANTVEICKCFLEKIKSNLPELKDAIEEIGKVKDSYLSVKVSLMNIKKRCESQRDQLSNEAGSLKRKEYREAIMASVLPAIAGVILFVPFIGPEATVSGSSVVVGLMTVAVKKYVEGCGAEEYRELIEEIKKVEHYFEETQKGLENSHEAITKKQDLLFEIERETKEARYDTENVLSGLGSLDDFKEDLKKLNCLCEDYLELSSSIKNIFSKRQFKRTRRV